MPYIKQPIRDDLDSPLRELFHRVDDAFVTHNTEKDGILNYVISSLVADSISPDGRWRYADIARAIAVFECAKLEFYRRIAGPKEDHAIEQNGDIDAYSP